MTQAKHTPGPWAVRYFGLNKDQIAVVSTVPIPDEYDGGEYEPIIADLYRGGNGYAPDARLIAAAPKMYELLKRYYQETPLGNQPHMIALEVEELLSQIEGA